MQIIHFIVHYYISRLQVTMPLKANATNGTEKATWYVSLKGS